MNYFYFFGLSLKKYSAKENFASKFFAVWSLLANTALLATVTFLTYNLWDLTHVSWKITIQMLSGNFCSFTACVILASTFFGRNQEKKFWKVLKKAGLINQEKIKNFIKLRIFKLALVSLSLVLQFLLLLLVLSMNQNSGNTTGSFLAYLNIAILRLYRLKFVMFMDILHLYLKQLQVKCGSHEVQRTLTQSISACWMLSGPLDCLFGLPMVFSWSFVFIATILNAFHICTVIYGNGLSAAAIFNSVLIVTEIFFVADANQKCKDTVSMIRTSIFSRPSRELHVEVLILKLHHQRIAFDSQKIITIDRKFLISVSF